MSSLPRSAAKRIFSVRVPPLNRGTVSAGTTVLLVYLFAGLPIQVGVLTQLGIPGNEAGNWFFITWLTTGLFSLVLAFFTRLPVSVNLSIPALIFLAGSAGGFSLPEILGANLMVGVMAVLLSVFRLNEAVARLVPSQVALGVFAGSMIAFMWKTTQLAAVDPVASTPALAGFVLVLAITRNPLLAVGGAAALGFSSVLVTQGIPNAGSSFALPQVSTSAIELDLSAILLLGLPLLVLTAGMGNIQALAILRSEGHRVRGDLLGLFAGLATVVNALGGGHAAAIGGTSTAVAAGPAAGPAESRFWAIVISSVPVVVIALLAVPVITVVKDLPISYTLTVGALALVAPLRQVLLKAIDGPMRLAALTAIVVAALPLQTAGMPMAFWALVAGIVVSVVTDTRGVAKYLRPNEPAAERA